ncbi:MAG TPA: DUF1156 domain-containing protein, partial [Chloroflexota bacterium]|nr:DUF1156 domain-containing protein [Chloroflexota bacterium]
MLNDTAVEAPVVIRKKLIEVAIPLDAINLASAREKSIRHGHPSTLHLWWARRPLAAARAVVFAQMVDDPSSCPELFPSEEAQDQERRRLFGIIENLVLWENTNNAPVVQAAREEIWKSWQRACGDNAGHPRASELFKTDILPGLHDPFAGGGSIPLEAQRLGLEAFASDLNPVAVLINKAMIEIPPKFAGMPPMNPRSRAETTLLSRGWSGLQGLAEDIHYYGEWIRDEAEKRLGHLYPDALVTADMVKDRPDLASINGQRLKVIAWLWVRTVKSPNPAFAGVDVPLAPNLVLSRRAGREAYVEPVVENGDYRFAVRIGQHPGGVTTKGGTKSTSSGAGFVCLLSRTPIPFEYIRSEAKAGRLGARLAAVIAEGHLGRTYLSPTPEMEAVARSAQPTNVPETELPAKALGFRIQEYGMTRWSDLFTDRQLVALTCFSDLVQESRSLVKRDMQTAGFRDDGKPLDSGGVAATAYADALAVYLACAVSRASDYWGTGTIWEPGGGFIAHVFTRNALPMTWDYPEANPFSHASGSWSQTCMDWVERFVRTLNPTVGGSSRQADAQTQGLSASKVVSTDPPYYDNIGYADLSDYFYLWLRRSLRSIFPDLFATVAVPKSEELVASPGRHGTKGKAEEFFLNGMTEAMRRLVQQAHPAFPITIYYAFKQSESDGNEGTASTGWETFLGALIRAGLVVNGTWPLRTERPGRMREYASNALATSIVLTCRRRQVEAPAATRIEFSAALKNELPRAVAYLQRGNTAPVDLAQAAIGPGMAVYTRYSQVIDAEGNPLPVRRALRLINQTLDEALSDQEGDFDADSRWALAWFEDHGFEDGPFGDAHTYFLRFNTAENALTSSGIIKSGRGSVRLLRPEELPSDWSPATDTRLTVWEVVQHLVRSLETGGEAAA